MSFIFDSLVGCYFYNIIFIFILCKVFFENVFVFIVDV